MIGVQVAAGTEGDDDIPLPTRDRIQEGRCLGGAVRRGKTQIEWIVGIIECPFPALVHDKGHQAVDAVGAVGKMDPEIGKVESRREVRSVAGGFDDLPVPGNTLDRFGRGHQPFRLAGEEPCGKY